MMALKKNSEAPIPRKMYLESFSTGGEFAGISSAVATVKLETVPIRVKHFE